jgi:hypothetical protein
MDGCTLLYRCQSVSLVVCLVVVCHYQSNNCAPVTDETDGLEPPFIVLRALQISIDRSIFDLDGKRISMNKYTYITLTIICSWLHTLVLQYPFRLVAVEYVAMFPMLFCPSFPFYLLRISLFSQRHHVYSE